MLALSVNSIKAGPLQRNLLLAVVMVLLSFILLVPPTSLYQKDARFFFLKRCLIPTLHTAWKKHERRLALPSKMLTNQTQIVAIRFYKTIAHL